MRAWQSSVVYGAGFALALASVFVAACASNDDPDVTPEDTQTPVPDRDAGGLDGADADGEACTGDDCEYFVDACEPGALCPSGLFGDKPTSGVAWRARVEAIRGRSATDAWLVGTMNLAAHFDGTAWRSVDVGGTDSLLYLLKERTEDVLDLGADVPRDLVLARDESQTEPSHRSQRGTHGARKGPGEEVGLRDSIPGEPFHEQGSTRSRQAFGDVGPVPHLDVGARREERGPAPDALGVLRDLERPHHDPIAVREERHRGLLPPSLQAKQDLAEHREMFVVGVGNTVVIERPARPLGPG